MSQPNSVSSSTGLLEPSGNHTFVNSSFLKNIPPEFQTSKMRCLLPKTLLSQTSKASTPSKSVYVSHSEGKITSYSISSVPQASEVSLPHLADENRSSPDTVDSILKHLSGSSTPHVVALTDAQVQKLLSVSPSAGVSKKQQMLHMVTVESAEAQPLSVTLDDQPLSVSIADHQASLVEEPVSLELLSETPVSSPLSVLPTASSVSDSLHPSESRAVSAPELPAGSAASQAHAGTQDNLGSNANSLKTVQERNQEEVVKKTTVEAFVKMVVCRKVTVQKVNPNTGQVLDTKIKLEEEEPVVLSVDCIETTEDLVSERVSPMKKASSLDGGLKFLSAVSESRRKIGKSLLSDILKSSFKGKGVKTAKQLSREEEMLQLSDVACREEDLKGEAKFVSDSEWDDEDVNDESEDYVPGKDIRTKVSDRQKKFGLSTKRAQSMKTLTSSTNSENAEALLGLYKKRGRKRKWDNALGIACNLKTCSFCSKAFTTPEACTTHMKKGKCVPAVFCLLCGKSCENEKQLEEHLANHEERSKSRKYECRDCKRTYRTRAGYVKHFRMGTCQKRDEFEAEEVGDFSCEICLSQFSTEAYLKLHKYKVHENPTDKHTCPDCGKKFYSTQGYNKHRSGRPCNEPLRCKICGKTYSSKAKESYKIHLRSHRTEATGEMFQCDECDHSYMTQVALNKHKLSHTGVKPYKCDICGKEFSMRYMVKDHVRTHTGERPYPCSLCGSAFSNRGHLGRHMRSHENGTLLKRGRPKKVKDPEENPLGLKVIDISSALQHLDRQTIQVVDGQMLDSQVSGTPMIIRTDNNTIIITEGWPANAVPSGSDTTATEPTSDTTSEVVCSSIASASTAAPNTQTFTASNS
ncbi:Zinc finger protein [Plakobranchus ocellatus]|uniref:Zinc finger protein n=1 Tax=Plakobranchus ocellatus TaxID=259542 RepID=A0AAV4CW19_9GAST|nr:Zinc finger protein [Plakobranchus ocellatus]